MTTVGFLVAVEGSIALQQACEGQLVPTIAPIFGISSLHLVL